MDYLPVAKQTTWLRSICQEVSKACIGWQNHVGCYTKKKKNEKLKPYESMEIYELLEINEFLEIRESFEIHESLESQKSLEIHESLQPIFRLIESFIRFIQIHESDSDSRNTRGHLIAGEFVFGSILSSPVHDDVAL